MAGIIKILGATMFMMGMFMVLFQFIIVQTLKKKGFAASMFMFLPSDLRNYKQLIDNEKNETNRNQMKINFYAVIIAAAIAISCFISVILIVVVFR